MKYTIRIVLVIILVSSVIGVSVVRTQKENKPTPTQVIQPDAKGTRYLVSDTMGHRYSVPTIWVTQMDDGVRIIDPNGSTIYLRGTVSVVPE